EDEFPTLLELKFQHTPCGGDEELRTWAYDGFVDEEIVQIDSAKSGVVDAGDFLHGRAQAIKGDDRSVSRRKRLTRAVFVLDRNIEGFAHDDAVDGGVFGACAQNVATVFEFDGVGIAIGFKAVPCIAPRGVMKWIVDTDVFEVCVGGGLKGQR